MSHDHIGRSNPDRDSARDSNERQPITNPTASASSGDTKEVLLQPGLEERGSTHERGNGEDHQEERLVALIRQEVRQEVNQFYFEAETQLHSPEALEGYKRVDASMPSRILAMAEKDQQAQIDADVIPIKAEAYAYKFAVTMVSSLPMALIILGVILVLAGKDSAGYVAAVAGIIGGGAQIIGQVRPTRQGRSKDGGQANARHK